MPSFQSSCILTSDEIQRISKTYHNWRAAKDYEDIKGFCKSASLEEVAALGYTLTPGRFVGLEESEQSFDFETEFTRLRAELETQIKEEQELKQRILANLALIAGEKQ